MLVLGQCRHKIEMTVVSETAVPNSALMKAIGTEGYSNFNVFVREVEMKLKALGLKLSASEKKQIIDAVS